MNTHAHNGASPLLILPAADTQPLSIRAKALVFNDPRSRELLAQIEQVGASNVTALLMGETGTGKELVARHLHACSGRTGPFIAVNCGAFSETLIDAELFGHEAGAFTGAHQARAGWIEAAHGGTLFLDEIGDMPMSMQVKLLRVLQERQVVRIGARQPLPVDVRLIAATNVDLAKAMRAGHFRTDLFYRLHVAVLHLPPLRERPGDILALARHFMHGFATKLRAGALGFSPAAERALLGHAWPGNIRELENVVHYAVIVASGERIEAQDLRLPGTAGADEPAGPAGGLERIRSAVRELLENRQLPDLHDAVLRATVLTAYEHAGQNQLRTARDLGISRNVLRAYLQRFGLLKARRPD